MNNANKSLAVSIALTLVLSLVLYYFWLPPLNLRSSAFWVFLLFIIVLFTFAYFMLSEFVFRSRIKNKIIRTSSFVVVGVAVFLVAGGIYSSQLFHAKKYASIIADQIETLDWAETMENKETITDIALMDTNTAAVFGSRTLGSLSDIVSQYTVSPYYTQINYQNSPQKVAMLDYAGFWKWWSNKDAGIPGYVIVDPVNSSGKYVKLDNAVMYSESEYFARDLYRTLRFSYPTEMFYDYNFEIDEDGHPYYIASIVDKTIGLFGGEVINRVVILDAVTGESTLMHVEDVPEWVDVVYGGSYLSDRLDWWGTYQNGFFNTLFSKTGCRQTTKDDDEDTPDYGYLSRDNDIWMYTGVTSVVSDSSNIGVVLANERTGQVQYFTVAGADEASAMAATEGEVQQYGYMASFPSLISVNDEPTYIMVLTDDNHIVKSYAMVNMANYSKVAVADSQAKVFAAYAQKMGFEVSDELEKELEQEGADENTVWLDVTFTIEDIQFIVQNGNTTVYITDDQNNHYKTDFDEFWILAQKGDEIQAKYKEENQDDSILTISSYQ
jgi:hypothetical protein